MFHVWYPFLPLLTYFYQLIDAIVLYSFLKLLFMLILVQEENKQDHQDISRHIFGELLNTSAFNNLSLWTCKSRHQLNFLFQNPCAVLLSACNLDQKNIPCLGYCKDLLSQVMMFYWIFPNQYYNITTINLYYNICILLNHLSRLCIQYNSHNLGA